MNPLFAFAASLMFGAAFYFPLLTTVIIGTSIYDGWDSRTEELLWKAKLILTFGLLGTLIAGGSTGILLYPLTWLALRFKRPKQVIWSMTGCGFALSVALIAGVVSIKSIGTLFVSPAFLILAGGWLGGAFSIYALRFVLQPALRRGFCTYCKYNLTGNVSGVCPECGTPVPHDVTDKAAKGGEQPRRGE